MENNAQNQLRAEFEQGNTELEDVRKKEERLRAKQAKLMDLMENEARLLNGIFDVHGKFPEMSEGGNLEEYVMAMRKEIRRVSLVLNGGLVGHNDDRWLNATTTELLVLTEKEDLTESDIKQFRELYEKMDVRRGILASRIEESNKKKTVSGVEGKRVYTREDVVALEKEREEIFRDKTIEDNDLPERMQEVDALRAQLIVRDDELYAAYSESRESKTDASETQKLDAAMKELASVVSGAYYAGIQLGSPVRHVEDIDPDSEFYIPESADGPNAPNFILKYDGRIITDNITRYNLRLYEPYNEKTGHREHVACVDIDSISEEVRAVVIPEAVWEENPRVLLPPTRDTHYLRRLTVTGLCGLLRVPNYIPTVSQGRTVESTGKNRRPEGYETKLYKDKKSSIRFLRRTIYPRDLESADLADKVKGLLEKWSPEERAVLEGAGGGQIRFVLLVNYSGRENPYYRELPDRIEESDIEKLKAVLEKSYVEGATDVTIVCDGSWIDREHKNMNPATSPSSHFRRWRGKTILVLSKKDDTPERRVAQEKIKKGISLSEEEKQDLMKILKLSETKFAIMVTQDGIHFKDGRWSKTPDSEHVPKYVMPE